MASKGGISGLAVAFATAGGLLVYAGFRGVSPLQALKDVSSGKPPPVAKTGSSALDITATPIAGTAVAAASGAIGGMVSSAAQKYAGDKYSQTKRTQSGWSDCSSFADKVLTDVGIPPPVKWAATANYRMSPHWRTIPASQAQPGDIAISSHHMVLVTAAGGTAAIGQQNPRTNVRTGSVAQLMGSQSYVYKRYVASTTSSKVSNTLDRLGAS